MTKNAYSHLVKLIVNLDCKEISNVISTSDINDLKKNIPTPLEDNICSVPNNKLNGLARVIIQCIKDIANKGDVNIEKYLSDSDYLINMKIGESEFESFLVQANVIAAARDNRNQLIALKYISELNSIFIQLQDLHVDFCIQNLLEFYTDSSVSEPAPIELFARDRIRSLIEYMQVNQQELSRNEKLIKLVDLLKTYHVHDSRGIIFLFGFC